MIVAIGQLASLGIRDRLVRMVTWVATTGLAAALAAVSVAAATVPYLVLTLFALWKLSEPR